MSATKLLKSGVLLLSGGVESTTLLHHLKGAKREVECSREHCNQLGLSLFELDLSSAGHSFRDAQKAKLHVPIPHRNLTILSLALSYASMKGSELLYIGLNKDDDGKTHYPSASRKFIEKFRSVAQTVEPNLQISTPFSTLTKAEIIRLGTTLAIDWQTTYSCMLGYEAHCGTCMQCKDRKKSFKEAGVEESLHTYRA